MLAPEQSRAARSWLCWSQDQLAAKAKVSVSTIRDFETGKRAPIANNLEAIERALSEAGVVLLNDERGGPVGIRVEAKG